MDFPIKNETNILNGKSYVEFKFNQHYVLYFINDFLIFLGSRIDTCTGLAIYSKTCIKRSPLGQRKKNMMFNTTFNNI